MAQAFGQVEDLAIALDHRRLPQAVVVDQGLTDEDPMGIIAIDPLIGHHPPVADWQAAPGDGLDAHHLFASRMPLRVTVPTLDPLTRQGHHPFGIDGGAQTRE